MDLSYETRAAQFFGLLFFTFLINILGAVLGDIMYKGKKCFSYIWHNSLSSENQTENLFTILRMKTALVNPNVWKIFCFDLAGWAKHNH